MTTPSSNAAEAVNTLKIDPGLNPKILHDALLATAHKRGSEKYLNQAEEVFDEVENDLVMQKLWEAYCKKFSYASDLEWDVIMKAIHRLYVLCEKGISV